MGSHDHRGYKSHQGSLEVNTSLEIETQINMVTPKPRLLRDEVATIIQMHTGADPRLAKAASLFTLLYLESIGVGKPWTLSDHTQS